jgi:hypothetical protein
VSVRVVTVHNFLLKHVITANFEGPRFDVRAGTYKLLHKSDGYYYYYYYYYYYLISMTTKKSGQILLKNPNIEFHKT